MSDEFYDPADVLNQLADFANNQLTLNHAHQSQLSNILTFVAQGNATNLLLTQRLERLEYKISALEDKMTK